MKIVRLTVVLVFSLTACNSFNTTRYTTPGMSRVGEWQAYEEKTPAPKPQVRVIRDSGVCPKAQWPAAPKLPPLPKNKLQQIDPKDDRALTELTLTHIEEIRREVQRFNHEYAQARARYESSCRSYQQKRG